ncbi:MAG: hypothetical protein C4576_21165 [Desulfobacteraceae bacterium]|nr:MAG: hypothetical protein C4576_21165 [Desulfobacteraceae bacterium]
MINFCGLKLKNPFVVAAGPVTNTIEKLRRAEEFGAAAVSTKLTFLKKPIHGVARYYTEPRLGLVPMFDPRMEVAETAKLVSEAKKQTALAVFCNMTHGGDDVEGWVEMGRVLEGAGADALELNFNCPNITLTEKVLGNANPETFGALIGQDPDACRRIISGIKQSTAIPVLAKLSSRVTDIGRIAAACKEAGVDAVICACGAPSLPPTDIYNRGRIHNPHHSGVSLASLLGSRANLFHAFANVATVTKRTGLPVIGGGGIRTWEDAIQIMMWGGRLVTACSVLMLKGFKAIQKIVKGMEEFLKTQGYGSYEEIIGLSLPYLQMGSEIKAVPVVAEIDPKACKRCEKCLGLAHCEGIHWQGESIVVRTGHCFGCGVCRALCPQGAIRMTEAR